MDKSSKKQNKYCIEITEKLTKSLNVAIDNTVLYYMSTGKC